MAIRATNRNNSISYLDTAFSNPIRDPLWGHIYLDDGMMKLLDTAPVLQLHRIKQLGPCHQVYPGATHTRLNHSLGVLHLARRMLRSLLAHPDMPDVSLESVKGFLCAALLHDTGHFPYTHSLKELPLVDHEVLTGRIVQEEPIAGILRTQIGTDPAAVAAIVDQSMPTNSLNENEITFFRHILSSPVDPDKLDYLNRDAYFCGVPYGTQDTDFVLNQIVPHPQSGLGLSQNGISALENLLFSKYLMYRAVYWHRTVRIATGMIKKALYLSLENGSIQAADLYQLDDELFFARMEERNPPDLPLITAVRERHLYKSILELPFQPENPAHTRLTNLKNRIDLEATIAKALSSCTGTSILPRHVLIDIPESISFEVDMPVLGPQGWQPYTQVRSVFTPQVVQDFTAALRLIRIAVAPEIANEPNILQSGLQAATELLHNGMD